MHNHVAALKKKGKNIPVTNDENMHIIIIVSVNKINEKNIPVTIDENMHIIIIVSV